MNEAAPIDAIEMCQPVSAEEFVAQNRALFATSFRSQLGAVPWAKMDLPGAEHEWLIKGVLVRREMAMLAGAMQSGKSFLALDISFAVARGQPWFGRKARRGGVLYLAAESGLGLKKRVRAYRLENDLEIEDDIPFVLLPRRVNLFAGDEHAELVIAEGLHWASTFSCPLELLVIDTFSASTPGVDEISGKDVGPVMDRCRRIAEKLNCAVLIIHHLNQGGEKPRGHTSLTADIESLITVHKTEQIDADRRYIREAKLGKSKEGEDGFVWKFVLPAIELWRDEDGDPVTSCVVRVPNIEGQAGDTDKSVDDGVQISDQCGLFLRAVHETLRQYGEAPHDALRLPPEKLVARFGLVRQRFGELAFDGDAEGDAEKKANKVAQAIKRHGEKLMSLRVIDRQSGFVWLTGRKVRGFRRDVGRLAVGAPDNAVMAADVDEGGGLV